MLKAKVIGTGAAGNKAAIELVNSGKFPITDITLINSTDRDIPEEYHNDAIIFGKSRPNHLGGCGKERTLGKKMFIEDIKNRKIDLDGIVDKDTNFVIIVSSTEGGSGSASAPIIAKYIRTVLNIPVVLVLFFGFNTDARGMQNSIELCQELESSFTVIGISNEKFLNQVNGNKSKAEHLANKEFCNIVSILTGADMKPGNQNIDRTDLYKLVTTPGYMAVGTTSLKNAKNSSMIGAAIKNGIDESKFVDTSDKSAKRMGLIFNIPEDMEDSIDINGENFVKAYGIPYEMYTHIQYADKDAFMRWIVAGMNLPVNAINEIYEKYMDTSANVSKGKDAFFSMVRAFEGDSDNGMFDMMISADADDDDEPHDTKSAMDKFIREFGPGKYANV